jgi:3-deoxy-D-manno-octulosonic-acid transferase
MRYIYSILFYLALPFIFLRLWLKSRKNSGYMQDWRQRLGLIKPLDAQPCIWIHAVSVGEMITAKPLLQALQQHYPNAQFVITNMTPTGLALAKQMQGNNLHHYYVPYDFPGAVTRFLNNIQPQLLIIMETELWPNLIHYTAQRKIPIVLANARLSEKSARGYQKIRSLVQDMLQAIRLILVQTQAEAERYVALGASRNNIVVTGSIKFDVPAPMDKVEEGHLLRASWGERRPTLIAASTHAGEEELVLQAFTELRKKHPEALLILVPRHQERFDMVAQLCVKQGFSVVRRTDQQPCTVATQIFLGDTLGELFLYYAAADIAYVGGSLVPVGGHNLLEPAVIGLPIITGHYLFNFTEIFNLLNKEQAVVKVDDAAGLAQTAILLLEDEARRQRMGLAAQQVVEKNRGALKKQLDCILSVVF